MATVPHSLVWEIVRKNNSFLIKQFGNGNAKPASGKEVAVVLSTTKTKKQNKPASLHHKSVMRKESRKMAKAVKNQVGDNYYRPDLTKPALARLSAVYRSLQVAKSGVKKNRQAN
ncbi:unnamed protein product [Miscanthus lutarioriparius]|uniref:Ribosomal eL28/Mak16 domain-containing protein n=1 Tax=Miscanthus lutarioriparius TaxID=422564 RepID=A0A811P0M3_9POAL|nr:unnamed protein product [Miscanthus lutarioriparius]